MALPAPDASESRIGENGALTAPVEWPPAAGEPQFVNARPCRAPSAPGLAVEAANKALSERGVYSVEIARAVAQTRAQRACPEWRYLRDMVRAEYGRILREQPEMRQRDVKAREQIVIALFNGLPHHLHGALGELRTIMDLVGVARESHPRTIRRWATVYCFKASSYRVASRTISGAPFKRSFRRIRAEASEVLEMLPNPSGEHGRRALKSRIPQSVGGKAFSLRAA